MPDMRVVQCFTWSTRAITRGHGYARSPASRACLRKTGVGVGGPLERARSRVGLEGSSHAAAFLAGNPENETQMLSPIDTLSIHTHLGEMKMIPYHEEQPLAGMTEIAEDAKLGPAMKALTPKARAFVMALVELGGRNMSGAALTAGFTGTKASLQVTASRMAADTKVQAALVEEAKALARSSSLAAVAETVLIMQDAAAPKQVRLNAASRIMALAALEPEKTMNVNHTVDVGPTSREQIADVIRLARDVGVDPRKLLGKAGVVLDVDFKVVNDRSGLEDLL